MTKWKWACFAGALFLVGCTNSSSDLDASNMKYLQATQARIGEWEQILGNLKRNRDMHAVHSDLYRKRSETVQFLEKEVKQVEEFYQEVKKTPTSSDARSRLENKLTELKEGYFRPSRGE